MKIAISLLTCNDLQYLKPCLTSLFNSDLNDHEFKLFILDNNSYPEMMDYINSLNVNKCVLKNLVNEGIVIPRIKLFNEIIKENFDFLLEIHSDMLFPKEWLNILLELNDEQTMIIQPHIYLPKNMINVETLEEEIKNLKYSKIYDKCRQVHPWLIKLEFVDKIGGYYDKNFSPQECEDDDFIYRVMINNYKIKSTGDSWVCHYGGVTRHTLLSSYFGAHKDYFQNKHNIDFNVFINMFEYHPYKYE